ncbi:MAG: adenylosuccinate lyase [candidate division WS6 bacterium 34_10]|uniref:Adenylosuccinate lyase n=1 Tax=candidate division WS6 bacterium 34_10 TaxID=1641389 RepID=A0A101HIC0_9BACT|nr:MAG: adenylosuccinate lyase [candidate division WS6 bacterium 34_10]
MAEFKEPKEFSNLQAISSVDGRFRGNVEEVSEYFSEYATMKTRVELETEWLIHINEVIGDKEITQQQKNDLRKVYESFSIEDAQWIQDKDLEINHDTKSSEYFLRMKMEELGMEELAPLVHIGLTSADVDDNAVRLSVKRFEEEHSVDVRSSINNYIKKISLKYKDGIFLAKTHGRQAVPSTMGKEFANYYNRLVKIDKKLKGLKFEGKVTGAVGNWNALYDRYPDVNWIEVNRAFLEKFELEPNMFTTQILPYDNLVEYLHLTHQYNYVLINLAKDMWKYISEGYFELVPKEGEVGSSTMAHKVNPISFEGCESHLIISNGIIETLAKNLPTNRLQRDVTDKYMIRELGPVMANSILGYSMIYGGITNVEFNQTFASEELSQHWEILSEPMQTILRTHGYQDAYEVIKEKTRGKKLTEDEYMQLVDELRISKEAKKELQELRPDKYIGWAKDIVKKIK